MSRLEGLLNSIAQRFQGVKFYSLKVYDRALSARFPTTTTSGEECMRFLSRDRITFGPTLAGQSRWSASRGDEASRNED